MKKLIAALAAFFVLVATLVPASAVDRTQHLTGLNPPSTWMNLEQRDVRLGFGAALWMMLAGNNTSYAGTFSNCTVTPVTGLYVAVAPTASNTLCTVYQLLADDTLAYGGYPSGVGTFLPADPTTVILQGLVPSGTTTANIGPLTAGTSAGQSVDDLIECKVTTFDTTSQTVNIVSSGGSVSSTSVNRDRVDRLSCQFKAGTSATTGTQTPPTVDSGYVAIGYVAVANGTVTINSGMVTGSVPFYGFAPLTASGATALDTSSNAQTKAGALTVNGTFTSTSTIYASGGGGLGLQVAGTTPFVQIGTAGTVNQSGGIYMGSGVSGSSNSQIFNSTTLGIGGVYCNEFGFGVVGVSQSNCFDAAGDIGTGGYVVANVAYSTSNNAAFRFLSAVSGQYTVFGSSSVDSVSSVSANALGIANLGVGELFALDTSGNVGVKSALKVGTNSVVGAAGTISTTSYGTGTTQSYVPPVYSTTGAALASTVHMVYGSCATTATASCGATLSNAAAFTNSGTWSCSGTTVALGGTIGVLADITGGGTSVVFEYSDLNSRTSTINFSCVGY